MSKLPVFIASRLLQLALILQLSIEPIIGLKCFRTTVGSTPHTFECDPMAKGCRVLVKPYKVQNNSAVTDCSTDQLKGMYLFDCATECPTSKASMLWNELECCTSDNCNSGTETRKVRKCYISKGKGSSEYDTIVPCVQPKRCAVNLKTEETKCIEESLCIGGDWKCCEDDACNNLYGVEKIILLAPEEESMDANSVAPSIALAVSGAVTILVVALQSP